MADDVMLNDIPIEFRERYLALLEIVGEFCQTHLNDEYLEVCTQLVGDLCQEGSPVLRGQARSWAAGVIWTIGRVNFLSDPTHPPTLKQTEFAELIGVSLATISAKSRDIWNGFEMQQFDPDYTVASLLGENPYIWILEIDGFLVDVRSAPRELQQQAFDMGLIPYIPADRESV